MTLERRLLTVVFLFLLALPAMLQRWQAPPARSGGGGLSGRHGFAFEEVGAASGIRFTHCAPRLDSKLDHIMPQVAAMGASVSVADFDRNGFPDLYVTSSGQGSANALYRNKGDGTFEDVAASMGVANLNGAGHGCSTGSVWGDYDNDGYEDLFVYRWGRPELFHNEAGKSFKSVAAGLPAHVNANSALWFDYDRDGHLDLLIAGYFDEKLDLWKLENTQVMPESFEYASNGGRKFLMRNKGDGTFEDVTEAAGITSRRWALAVAAADVFGSGYPDLFIANDYGVSELYRNLEGKGFREVGKETGVGTSPKSGMNASFGDVFNQGKLSIYVSNISEEGILIQGNNLWVPRTGAAGVTRFDNLARVAGVELGGWSFGAQFGDLDNDGFQDLFLVNGYVSADPSSSYWYDFAKVAGGHDVIIRDAANWPAMKGRSLSGFQAKKVWLNDGAGRFSDVASEVGITDRHDGRAVALVDLWNRGATDVVVANQCGPLLVHRNKVRPDRAWVGLDLEGTRSNRSAIGARVTLTWRGRKQVQEVHGGSGFASQNDRRLHFGLGVDPGPVRAEIRWPSGGAQVLEAVQTNRTHKVKEAP